MFIQSTNSVRSMRLKYSDYVFLKENGVQHYIQVIIQKYFSGWLSEEFRLFKNALNKLIIDQIHRNHPINKTVTLEIKTENLQSEPNEEIKRAGSMPVDLEQPKVDQE